MKRKVIPFQIAIGPRSLGATYQVRASFERVEIRTELGLDARLRGFAERLRVPGAALPLASPLAFGRALGRALFTPLLGDLLLRSAKAAAQAGARLQLQLQIGPPELAALPWEWLTLGVERPWSPALRDEYGLARLSRSARPLPPLPLGGPLQVLAVAAPGEELQLRALETALAGPIRAGRIALRIIGDATPASLEHGLLAGPVHLLHCAAPVARTERGTPRLLLRRSMDLFDLAELLANTRSLRLVTLTGAQGDGSAVSVDLAALAAMLLTPDLPASIAFTSALPARLAAEFAATCYASLAAGQPIDLATTAGRRALAQAGDRGWGAPQLRLAADGAQLFAPRQAAPISRRLARTSLAAAAGLALGAVLLFGAPTAATLLSYSAAGATPAPTAALLPVEAARASAPTPSVTPASPTAPAPSPAPTEPAATPAPPPADAEAPSGYATFLSGPDDTPEQIAARMGSDAAAIAALNHLDLSAPLRAGRPLVIPIYRAGAAGAGGMVIRHGNPAERKVALTFDIEIDDKTLYGLLDILRQRGLHGTFFVTGRWVQAFPNAARAIVQEGHEIGNHSLTHPYFSRIGLDGAASEIEKTEQIVHDTTGATARPYFRFPYGDFTADTSALVAREGYVAYHWSADDGAISGWLDWAAQHPSEANGGILLLHGRPGTVNAFPGWLDRLAALGLEPTTLTDTLR